MRLGQGLILTACLFTCYRAQAADIVPATVYQGLTEIFARKTYDNDKPVSSLYSGLNLQPEVLHFNDTTYGTHVWSVTFGWNAYSIAHNHINRSPWNSNGSKLGLLSNRRFVTYWYNVATGVGDPHAYLMDTDGDNYVNVRAQGCPNCNIDGTRIRSFVWDRNNPNYCYFSAMDGLYRLDVTLPGQYVKVASLTNTTRNKSLYSYNSEQNTVMVMDDLGNNYSSPMFYFVDLNKSDGEPGQVVSYPIALNISWPGHDLAKENSFHDIYFTRRPDGTYSFNYGPISSVGEPIFFIAPLDGNASNVILWYDNAGNQGIPYHSHPAWGPGGAQTAYFGEKYPYGSNIWGWHVIDDASKTHVKKLGTYANGEMGGGHIAWDGNDPDFLFCASGIGAGRKIFRAHVSGPENNAEPFVMAYTGLNPGTTEAYQTTPRPAQSPDGTKVMFHSSMISTSAVNPDMFIAVARYPFAPQNVAGSGSGGKPRLTWNQPQFHNETRYFNIYRSVGGIGSFSLVASAGDTTLDWTDSTAQDGVDHYYGLTSQEWSGLESTAMSNIVKINCSGGSCTASNFQAAGLTGFDVSAPAPVTGLTATNTSDGVYTLGWSASAAADLWYYNVYYSVEGVPAPVPARRIASVPRSKTSYIDWRARKGVTGFYTVTAVDRQGNESGSGDTVPPAKPTGFRKR